MDKLTIRYGESFQIFEIWKFFLGFSVQRHRMNVLCTTLHQTSFWLNEWRDVRTQKSRLKYKIQFNLYHKLYNKKNFRTQDLEFSFF